MSNTHNHTMQRQAPKYYRKMINNKKRSADKERLRQAIQIEDYDNMPVFKWYKDAGYTFW